MIDRRSTYALGLSCDRPLRPVPRVAWSKEVRRIDADQAHAVITALVLEDAAGTPREMRGIRINLSSEDANDQVYAGEDLLDRLIKALDEISNGLPRFLARRPARGCFGPGIFWLQSGHALSASQCVFPDWSGLAVSNGRRQSFRFTGLDPAPFAAAIAGAREELKLH